MYRVEPLLNSATVALGRHAACALLLRLALHLGGWELQSRASLDLESRETRSLPRRGCSACLGSWGVESPAKSPLSGRVGSRLVISAAWGGREGIPRMENEQQEAESPPVPQGVRLRRRAGPSP